MGKSNEVFGLKETSTDFEVSFRHSWSARADATEAVVDGYNSILNALRDIKNGLAHAPEARHEARVLGNKMDSLETALMAKIWNHNTCMVQQNE